MCVCVCLSISWLPLSLSSLLLPSLFTSSPRFFSLSPPPPPPPLLLLLRPSALPSSSSSSSSCCCCCLLSSSSQTAPVSHVPVLQCRAYHLKAVRRGPAVFQCGLSRTVAESRILSVLMSTAGATELRLACCVWNLANSDMGPTTAVGGSRRLAHTPTV